MFSFYVHLCLTQQGLRWKKAGRMTLHFSERLLFSLGFKITVVFVPGRNLSWVPCCLFVPHTFISLRVEGLKRYEFWALNSSWAGNGKTDLNEVVLDIGVLRYLIPLTGTSSVQAWERSSEHVGLPCLGRAERLTFRWEGWRGLKAAPLSAADTCIPELLSFSLY